MPFLTLLTSIRCGQEPAAALPSCPFFQRPHVYPTATSIHHAQSVAIWGVAETEIPNGLGVP